MAVEWLISEGSRIGVRALSRYGKACHGGEYHARLRALRSMLSNRERLGCLWHLGNLIA